VEPRPLLLQRVLLPRKRGRGDSSFSAGQTQTKVTKRRKKIKERSPTARTTHAETLSAKKRIENGGMGQPGMSKKGVVSSEEGVGGVARSPNAFLPGRSTLSPVACATKEGARDRATGFKRCAGHWSPSVRYNKGGAEETAA